MPVSYDAKLVVLSVLIAMQGSYVCLFLARRLTERRDVRRKLLLVAAALSLGTGIWAMHFIGMLAFQLPVAIAYDVLLTLVSALVCILVVGLGVFVASYGPLRPLRLAGAGTLMGGGIATMHYIGMAALRADCVTVYDPPLVAASVGVAIGASSLALWLSFVPGLRFRILAGAATMGAAISGMHYTGMAAASFLPVAGSVVAPAPALSPDLLAIVIAITAFLMTGAFLLILVPDPPAWPAATAGPGGDAAMPLPDAEPAPPAGSTEDGPATASIPVTRNGRTLLLPAERILAIQADAHYSRIYDGDGSYFCGRSISELERQLDRSRFLRVHRSYIVNLAHARGFRKVRDHGEVEVHGIDGFTVPVSRSRVSQVRSALGL